MQSLITSTVACTSSEIFNIIIALIIVIIIIMTKIVLLLLIKFCVSNGFQIA